MFDRSLHKGVPTRKTSIDVEKIKDIYSEALRSAALRTAEEKTKVSFAPSSIGYGNGKCSRYWYLAFDGAMFDPKIDDMGAANLLHGRYVHDKIEELFRNTEEFVSTEAEVFLKDPPVRGFIDVILKIDGEWVIVEVKSIRSEKFNIKANSQKPDVHHLYQMLIYLKGTGKDRGVLLYENKNDQSIAMIPIEMDEENEKIINDAFAWMREVYNNWESGPNGENLPKRNFTKSTWVCKSCPLFNTCWNERDAGTVEIAPMEVAKL